MARRTIGGLSKGIALISAIAVGQITIPEIRAQALSEYQVKAAFLLNFTKFVDWPDQPGPGGHDSIHLCVVGDDPFGKVLDAAVKGQTANGRDFVVERFTRAENARGCQIAFISASETKRLGSILASFKGASVLTVGETEGFARRGGIINFVLEENHVRFEVNPEAAERANLKISSRLLSLARIVKGKS